jgi:transcriptional regulator with XRE-family HTH domain
LNREAITVVLTRKDAASILRDHFENVSPDEFRANLARYSPEVISEGSPAIPAITPLPPPATQLTLLTPRAAPLPLNGYLACALTGLSGDQRQLVELLSDTVTRICEQHGIDVYQPSKKTDPVHHPHVPDDEVYRLDRDRVSSADLLIFLSHFPSVGAGEELEIASKALVPMILVSHSETRVSRMVTGIPALKLEITYSEPDELRLQLEGALLEIRPVLEARKLAFADYEANLIGERVRQLREGLRLTREEVATSARLSPAIPPSFLTVERLREIEVSGDRTSNPSLIELRVIAAVLRTTVAELVEPDLGERVIATLQRWLEESADDGMLAARWGMSARDRNRILRRILLRMIDSLEQD